MEKFIKILTVTQTAPDIDGEIHVIKTLETSVAWHQLYYCHPHPSNYIDNVTVNLSEDKSYAEFHADHNSLETYNDWFKTFGEISEELYKECIDELETEGLIFERFFSDVDNAQLEVLGNHAQPLKNFISKI